MADQLNQGERRRRQDGGVIRSEGDVLLLTEQLRIRITRGFSIQLYLKTPGGWLSPCVATVAGDKDHRPFHYPVFGDRRVVDFALEPDSVCSTACFGEFGEGTQFVLQGVDATSLPVPIRLELTIEIYRAFPTAALVRSVFRAEGPQGLSIRRIVLNNLRLDARLIGGANPYDMWVYNGSAELREHCLQALTENYFKRNYLGVLESHDGGGYQPGYRQGSQPGFGGGIPVVGVWNKHLGIAVGHVEPAFQRCSIPIRVRRETGVDLGVVEYRRDKPGVDRETRSFVSFVLLHRGDFYNSLAIYRDMLAARGIRFPANPDQAYEPQWDTWGFREDFSPEDVLTTIPHLKEIGINWITLDDRWYDAVGDWLPRPDRYPGGEEEFARFVDQIHKMGMKVRLWTIPGEVDADPGQARWLASHPSATVEIRKHPDHARAKFYTDHPDWVVVDPQGEKELSKRGHCYCCGSLRGVREHFRRVADRMFGDWRIDGLKQDAVYICSACFSSHHGHKTPDDATRDYARILQEIYETALRHNPEAVIVNCPCGTTLTPDWMQFQNQAIVPDPWTSWVNRGIVKQLKALFGPSAAIVLDHIELSDEGLDFSLIGVGGVPATRITPTGKEKTYSSDKTLSFEERKTIWTRWIRLYRELMLSKGEYLNLYDLVYDTPETHVIRKGGDLYYAFYPGEPDGIVADQRDLYKRKRDTKRFRGRLEFRGLESETRYRVFDYENQKDMGEVTSTDPFLETEIDHHLLVKVSPRASWHPGKED